MSGRIFLSTAFLILFLTPSIFGQEIDRNYLQVEEPSAGNFFGVSARAMGMGGAQIATANDAAGLVYNPARLTKVKRIEFSGGMTHQRIENETGYTGSTQPLSSYYQNESITQSNTRFSSANIVLPVPTYRGSLVFAAGVNRMMSFDHVFHSTLIDPDLNTIDLDALALETGGINMWSFGGALDLSPNISVGAAVNYWKGQDDYLQEYYIQPSAKNVSEIRERNQYLYDYSGWNAKLGLSVDASKFLSLGATVDFPTKFSIDQDFNFNYDSTDANTQQEFISQYEELGNYDLTHPYSFGLGAALSFKFVTLAGDVYFTDWSQLKPSARSGVDERLYKLIYQNVTRWHVGAEFALPELATNLRIGFYEDPIPFKSTYLKTDRRYFTLGAGFLIDQVMTADIAWNHGIYEFRDDRVNMVKESYTVDKFFLTLAYRL
ncbi:MAG TPA: outer membrane protein transport protein [Terriglobales bacterium]|nr:outer membrane protein transport protein [Terriglobales bacterium]